MALQVSIRPGRRPHEAPVAARPGALAAVWAWAPTTLAVVLAAAAMTVGAAQKLSCSVLPQSACYSDVQSLWRARYLGSHVLPYVHGSIQGATFVGHELEYPVLTGMFVWLCSLPAHSEAAFMAITMAALAPFGLLTAWLLARLAGRRALLFAATPVLVWYSFLNWDLLGVAACVAAIYAWSRGWWRTAGILLGVGACFKLWPGYLLMPLVADLLCRRRYRAAAEAVASSGAVVVLANLPFMIANYAGWRAPFVFQSLRPADQSANSVWTALDPGIRSVGTVNHLATGACAGAFAVILAAGYVRFRREGVFPFMGASAAFVASFIALGKVHSPQYALWILPFFALLRIGSGWWLLYLVSDLWLFAQFTVNSPLTGVLTPWHTCSILLSDGVLLVCAAVALRSDVAVGPAGAGGLLGPGPADLLGRGAERLG